MDVNMTTKDIADAIANAVTDNTSIRCETFTGASDDAIIIADYIHLVARIVPDYKSIKVVAAPSDMDGVVTDIPSKATSLSGIRELVSQLDDAIAHVIAAAATASRQ